MSMVVLMARIVNILGWTFLVIVGIMAFGPDMIIVRMKAISPVIAVPFLTISCVCFIVLCLAGEMVWKLAESDKD